MVLETPLLRVSRPVAACSRCRAAKVKCDGKLPACTACEKSNRAAECSSTNDQFARGKERSYVATLEARVEKLEKRINDARIRRKSSVAMPDYDTSAAPRRTSVETVKVSKPLSKRAQRRKENADIDELVSDFGLLAVNATARDFYGFTSAISYARLILSASSKEGLPAGMNKALPPKYSATPLVQHYLNNFFVLLPVFDEASFYASVDAVYHADPEMATAFDHMTVRMVLAISCLSLSEQRGDTHYSDAVGHVTAALEYAEDVLHPGFINSIQVLVLLVEYSMLDPHHFDSWTLIGAASRAMVDLGIHQDPSKSAGVSKAKLELRRRVYWCVYSLDRSTSLVQTRAFSFSDDSAHVGDPFAPNSLSSPSRNSPKTHVWLQSFDAALDLFRIRQLQSTWYMDLFQSGRDAWHDPYPYIWKIYNEMTHWFQDMPATALPSTKAFFELELLYSYVYILSPSSRIPHITEYAQRLIFEHCISYATNLLALMSKPNNTIKPPITFYDAMRAYMTGRQFVDVLARNQDVILDPIAPPPPPPSTTNTVSEDPLAPPAEIPAPPFPVPKPPSDGSMTLDPTNRAINAIHDFTSILSQFGLRFGYVSWRDRFQRESAALSAQLHHRASISPLPSPHRHSAQPSWTGLPTTPTPWGPMPPPSTGAYTQPPTTTPPMYSQSQSQPSPYGSTTSPGYGSTTSPGYGSTTSPGYGSTASPGYGPSPGTSYIQPTVDWSAPVGGTLPPPNQEMRRTEYVFPAMPVPPQGSGAGTGGGVPVSAAPVAGDLGIGSEMATTGWETLPGGSLNARFA